jgi:hypothetical protein
MIEATVEETIAAIHALRKAGGEEMKKTENQKEKERAIMKRKMDAARIIENMRIDQI